MNILRSSVTALLLAIAVTLLLASAARADLRLCNKTPSQVGVAIGYKNGTDWMTEGWWNIPANACQVLLAGTLSSRYYYVHAVDYDQGGEWTGSAVMCTRDKEFTIRGVADCVARGYKRTRFFEVDTGDQAGWTIQLTESANRGIGGR